MVLRKHPPDIGAADVRDPAPMLPCIRCSACARVCPVEVLCVGECVYNDKGEPPIMIGSHCGFSCTR